MNPCSFANGKETITVDAANDVSSESFEMASGKTCLMCMSPKMSFNPIRARAATYSHEAINTIFLSLVKGPIPKQDGYKSSWEKYIASTDIRTHDLPTHGCALHS